MSFQAAASRQGRAFEDLVEQVLVTTGWSVIERRWKEPTTLVEIDIVAADQRGEIWWIECKGSWESASGRNGILRTDTTKKLIGDAALLSTVERRPPYLLATSDQPVPGSQVHRWLEIAVARGWLTGYRVVSLFSIGPVAGGAA